MQDQTCINKVQGSINWGASLPLFFWLYPEALQGPTINWKKIKKGKQREIKLLWGVSITFLAESGTETEFPMPSVSNTIRLQSPHLLGGGPLQGCFLKWNIHAQLWGRSRHSAQNKGVYFLCLVGSCWWWSSKMDIFPLKCWLYLQHPEFLLSSSFWVKIPHSSQWQKHCETT